MNRILLSIIFLLIASSIAYHRYRIAKLPRTRTNGSSKITTSHIERTDQYEFFNRTQQKLDGYLQFRYTVFKDGLCANMTVTPLKRVCTPYLHYHLEQTETFVLVQGRLGYLIGHEQNSCDVRSCPSTIIIAPWTSHTFWMDDNLEDLVIDVRVEPIFQDRGLTTELFENIVGVRRDKHMSIWQIFLFMDRIDSYPKSIPFTLFKILTKAGAIIAKILGYRSEYDEYTTRS